MAKFSALLTTLALVGSTAEEPTSYLSDVYSGKVPKSKVEVVLAQHDEDIAWSNPLRSVRTVYCKGKHCDADAIQLPNVGREGHTFLHHIVNNYDSLADWTVFSQADKPSDGYVDHKRGGGHLLTGSSFEDYLTPHDDALFLMTSKVHLPTLRHSLRSSFKIRPSQLAAQIHSKSAVCPKEQGEDIWGHFQEVPQVRNFLERKCGVEDSALPDALRTFWEDFVQLPVPAGEVVHYAQGARFAVSRDRVLQRSKAFYQHLLDAISADVDPCLNYLFEFVWYYIIGTPSAAPCPWTADDLMVASDEARALADGGVSNGVSTGEDEPIALVTISGSMGVTVDDADLVNITEDSLADGIAMGLNISSEWVEASFTVDTGSSTRRLASATLTVTYTISLPEDASADTVAVDGLMGKLQDPAITTALSETISEVAKVSVTVTSVAAPSLVTVTQTSTTTTTQAGVASGSVRSVASLFACVLAAVAALF